MTPCSLVMRHMCYQSTRCHVPADGSLISVLTVNENSNRRCIYVVRFASSFFTSLFKLISYPSHLLVMFIGALSFCVIFSLPFCCILLSLFSYFFCQLHVPLDISSPHLLPLLLQFQFKLQQLLIQATRLCRSRPWFTVSLCPIYCLFVPDLMSLCARFTVSLCPIYCVSVPIYCLFVPDLLSRCARFNVSLCPIYCLSVPDLLSLCARFIVSLCPIMWRYDQVQQLTSPQTLSSMNSDRNICWRPPRHFAFRLNVYCSR